MFLKCLAMPFLTVYARIHQNSQFCKMGQKNKNKFNFQFQIFHSSKIFLHNVIIDSETACQDLSNGVCQNTAECLVIAQWVKTDKNKFSFQFQNFHSSQMFLHNAYIDSERSCQHLSNGVCQNTGECLVFAQWVTKIKTYLAYNFAICIFPSRFCTM